MLFLWIVSSMLSSYSTGIGRSMQTVSVGRLVHRKASPGFPGSHLTGHINMLQIKTSCSPNIGKLSVWQKCLWGDAPSRKWSWTSPSRKSPEQEHCSSALITGSRDQASLGGVSWGSAWVLGHSSSCFTLVHPRAFSLKGEFARLYIEGLLFPLWFLMAIILHFPQGSFYCSLGMTIFISHWL